MHMFHNLRYSDLKKVQPKESEDFTTYVVFPSEVAEINVGWSKKCLEAS